MTALRELAERLAKRIGSDPSTSISSKEVCELISILDAEGDGGAVGKVGAMPGTSGFTMACFQAADVPIGTELYTHHQPARSGVVSDEQVTIAVNTIFPMMQAHPSDYPRVRAALEHFIKSQGESNV